MIISSITYDKSSRPRSCLICSIIICLVVDIWYHLGCLISCITFLYSNRIYWKYCRHDYTYTRARVWSMKSYKHFVTWHQNSKILYLPKDNIWYQYTLPLMIILGNNNITTLIDIDISILISCIFDIVNITTRNKLDNIVYHHCIKILNISGYYLLWYINSKHFLNQSSLTFVFFYK